MINHNESQGFRKLLFGANSESCLFSPRSRLGDVTEAKKTREVSNEIVRPRGKVKFWRRRGVAARRMGRSRFDIPVYPAIRLYFPEKGKGEGLIAG